jgi:hypothetical protein
MIAWLTRQRLGGIGLALAFLGSFSIGLMAHTLVPASDRPPPLKETIDDPEASADREGQRLRDLDAVTRHVMTTKDRVLGKLVHGEWSLREAARCFQLLDEQKEGFNGERFRLAFPGGSLEESFGQAVLARLRGSGLLPREPEASQVLERLEAERGRTWPKPRLPP